MEENYTPTYIVATDEHNHILGITSAELGVAVESEINLCLYENLYDSSGCHKLYLEDGVIRSATPEELAEELSILNRPSEIAELKQKLADTDYVIIKIAEGVATTEEYAEIIEQRSEWRSRINELV